MLKSFQETIDLRSLGLIGLMTLGFVSLVGLWAAVRSADPYSGGVESSSFISLVSGLGGG